MSAPPAVADSYPTKVGQSCQRKRFPDFLREHRGQGRNCSPERVLSTHWGPGRRQESGRRQARSRNSLPALSAAAVVQVPQSEQRVLRKRETAAAGRLEDTPALTAQPEQSLPGSPASAVLAFPNSRLFSATRFACTLPPCQTGEAGRQKQGGAGGIISPACLSCLSCLSRGVPFHSIYSSSRPNMVLQILDPEGVRKMRRRAAEAACLLLLSS